MDTCPPQLYFDEFRLDTSSGELTCNGRPVELEHQPALVLARLAECSGAVVAREELASLLWGTSTYVKFDDGLNYCLRRIRVALQDDPRAPRFIETIPRRGYRFIAPVTRRSPAVSRPRRRVVPIIAAALFVFIIVLAESQPNTHHAIVVRVAKAAHDLIF